MFDLTKKQRENLKWFEDNLERLLKNPEYKNKYLVIHNKAILGAFDNSPKALDFALKKFNNKLDECIIQKAIDTRDFMNIVNVQISQTT